MLVCSHLVQTLPLACALFGLLLVEITMSTWLEVVYIVMNPGVRSCTHDTDNEHVWMGLKSETQSKTTCAIFLILKKGHKTVSAARTYVRSSGTLRYAQ